MPDVRTMFDQAHLEAADLHDKDQLVIIESVKPGKLIGEKGRESRKPIIKLRGKTLTFVCNKTNAKILKSLYGRETDDWVGKPIILFPTTCDSPTGVVPCIRVRPRVPEQRQQRPNGQRPPAEESRPQQPPPPEPGANDE